MTINLSPERTIEILQEHEARQRLHILEDAEIAQQKATQQAYIKAKVEATRLNEIHTAQKDYICDCCGKTIPKNAQYRRQNIPVGYGFIEGTHYTQRITHLVCEVKKP